MHAKHEDDPSTHMEYDLELWLKASISMTKAWDMKVSCSALIIRTPQSTLKQPSLVIQKLVQE